MEIATALRRGADGFSELVFSGVPGALYDVSMSWDLNRWQLLGSSRGTAAPVECAPDGFFFVHTRESYGERTFYRARRRP
jgi:hypothetical protein